MIKYIFALFTCLFSLGICFGQKSELIEFEYQGYSDTTYSIIGGQIFTDSGSAKVPLDSVEIVSLNQCLVDSLVYTDFNGRFLMSFPEGVFTIQIRKKGYQSIKLINYESDPDQISHLVSILRKGKGEVVFDIGKNKR